MDIKNKTYLNITSPQRDQQVPVGQLTISGTSTDNPIITTDCKVYVIDLNDIKPMQNATATGRPREVS